MNWFFLAFIGLDKESSKQLSKHSFLTFNLFCYKVLKTKVLNLQELIKTCFPSLLVLVNGNSKHLFTGLLVWNLCKSNGPIFTELSTAQPPLVF